LFFLINIFLVLNFIQVGNQQTTDRYTYIAYIGFFLLIAYGYKYILEKKPQLKSLLIIVILTIVVLFSYQSYQRTKVWNNSRSLWSDVIIKNNKLALAHSNLGVTYVGEDNEIAEEYFLKAIVLDPGFVIPYNNMGFLYIEKDPKKAEEYLFKAMSIDPSYLYIYTNLANLYMKSDKLKARKYILKAVALNPENKYVLARVNSWNKQWIR
jgi:tetratricopeptide (TPR) repeat protein